MKLADGEMTKDYSVAGMELPETVMRRLEALGIFEGTSLRILNKKKRGALIIKVRGTRWALGRAMAEGIRVEETKDENNH